MKTYQAKLKSASPYSSSKYRVEKKAERELDQAFEERTWRNKLTTNSKGEIEISAMAFKFALCSASKYIGRQIPGKGKRTYSKIFDSAILIAESLNTGTKKEDAEAVWVYVNADGKRGSGTRVMRCFPTLREWTGTLTIYVLDDAITKEVLLETLESAGQFIGVGQFRAERGGLNGRFSVTSLEVMKD